VGSEHPQWNQKFLISPVNVQTVFDNSGLCFETDWGHVTPCSWGFERMRSEACLSVCRVPGTEHCFVIWLCGSRTYSNFHFLAIGHYDIRPSESHRRRSAGRTRKDRPHREGADAGHAQRLSWYLREPPEGPGCLAWWTQTLCGEGESAVTQLATLESCVMLGLDFKIRACINHDFYCNCDQVPDRNNTRQKGLFGFAALEGACSPWSPGPTHLGGT
jgi:hypothetical protein